MIDVKQAVQIAIENFENLYGEMKYQDLKLEEVEISPDEKHWTITLGYDTPKIKGPKPQGLATLFSELQKREYKEFKIDAESGRMLSMRIRVPWIEPSRP